MSEEIKPTASSLKKELKESLELLIRDFEGLKNFVAEIAPEGIPKHHSWRIDRGPNKPQDRR